MLTKILFTIIVIVGVAIFYRRKAENETAQRTAKPQQETSIAPRSLAYILIGVLAIISVVVFFYSWQSANQIVNIRVTADGGAVSTYQAYQKDIKGRSFTAISGNQITLGASDRVEQYIE